MICKDLRTSAVRLAFVTAALVGPALAHAQDAQLTPAERALAAAAAANAERQFELNVPVLYDNTPIGALDAKVTTSGRFEAARDDVLGVLSNVLTESALAEVSAEFGAAEVVNTETAAQAGFEIRFNPERVALELTTERDVRRANTLDLNPERDAEAAFRNSIRPATVAAFLNLSAGVEVETADQTDLGAILGIDGAVRAGGFVLRGGAVYETIDAAFEVGTIQLVRDFVERDVRLTMGDVTTAGTNLLGAEDLIGVSLSHRSGQFGRPRSLQALSSTSFELDRSAIVEIYINEALARRSRLSPGVYNIADLDLRTGENDIRVVVIDDAGQREEIVLSAFSSGEILEPGELRWDVAGGIVTEEDLASLDFDTDDSEYFIITTVDYGVIPELSVGASAIWRDQGQAAGLTVRSAIPIGSLGLDVAASFADGDVGTAASLTFRPFLPEWLELPGRGFDISVFFASEDFSALALPTSNDDELRISARLTEPFVVLDTPVRTSLFGSYQRVISTNEDVYQVGASASFALTDGTSLGLSAGYERDLDGDSDVFGRITLSRALGPVSTSARYDTNNNSALVSAAWQNQSSGVGTLSAGASVASDEFDSAEVSGIASYTANRFLVAGSVSQDVLTPDGEDIESNATLTASTAIVFADGAFAISRPVFDSFAIVRPHSSLGEATVVVNPPPVGFDAGPEMSSDGLGNLATAAIGSYAPTAVQVELEGAPISFDFGEGLYQIAGPLNAGYIIDVGSDRAASVSGILVTAAGDPVALIAGRATSGDDETFAPQNIFTSQAGRFFLSGLLPGKSYRIDFAGLSAPVIVSTQPDTLM
ncbi:MAG: fimbria/pilus outer membrane usher protein [Pseudomonadota bacterium]